MVLEATYQPRGTRVKRAPLGSSCSFLYHYPRLLAQLPGCKIAAHSSASEIRAELPHPQRGDDLQSAKVSCCLPILRAQAAIFAWCATASASKTLSVKSSVNTRAARWRTTTSPSWLSRPAEKTLTSILRLLTLPLVTQLLNPASRAHIWPVAFLEKRASGRARRGRGAVPWASLGG